MIIVRLRGGLGNQLFQYSTGFRLAQKHKVSLMLNCVDYGAKKYLARDRMRSFELDQFAIHGQKATIFQLALYRQRLGNSIKLITEQHYHFEPAVLQAPANTYLDGFWQSYKYFEDVRSTLLKELTLKKAPSMRNRELLRDIKSHNAISVHVRRGDYVTDPLTVKYHGLAPLHYYHAAIERITKRVKDPYFYIFSDDPEWVKENLHFQYPTRYVDHNPGAQAFEDLRLMSHCCHFIIANSSFSWWGAWLAETPGKVVIAPKQWFRDTSKDTRDLTPPEWLRI